MVYSTHYPEKWVEEVGEATKFSILIVGLPAQFRPLSSTEEKSATAWITSLDLRHLTKSSQRCGVFCNYVSGYKGNPFPGQVQVQRVVWVLQWLFVLVYLVSSKSTITDANAQSYPSLHETSFHFTQVTMNPIIYAHQQKNAILELAALLGCYAA